MPIACSWADSKTLKAVNRHLLEAVKDIKDEVLIIASSDMSHYEPDALARKKDRLAIEAILALDEEELLRRVESEKISMCGVIPVSIMIPLCKNLQAHKAQVILYQTSGDSCGDYSAVVGYLGALIS